MDAAVKYLLRSHDTAVVDMVVRALIKENVNVNFVQGLDRKAVELNIEQLEGKEDMNIAHAAGRTPPFKVSRLNVRVVLQKKEAERRSLGRPFLEDPIHLKVLLFTMRLNFLKF